MTTPNLNDDDELMEALGQALEATDPVPESLVSFGRSARILFDLQSELAQLTADSDERELVALRSTAELRVLQFQLDDVDIELEVDAEVQGVCDPPATRVEVVTVEGTRTVPVSAAGLFRFPTPATPFRLRLTIGARLVRTGFIVPR